MAYVRQMRRHRAPPALFRGGFCYYVGYALSQIACVCVLYAHPSSILFADTDSYTRDTALEFWLWAALISSWIMYVAVQGSDPGYILPGKEPLPPLEADRASGEHSRAAAGEAAAREAAVDAGAVRLEADSTDEAAPPAAGAAAEASAVDRDMPADASGDAAAEHAGPVARRHEHERSGLLFGDADPDFDLEHAADPVHERELALELARQGERHCKWCNCRQPARAHHCKLCNKCVATFDHHCGVLGTCIGERNRCRFWGFLLTQMISLAFAIGILNTGFVYRRSTTDWVAANALAIMSLIVLWIAQATVFSLLVFHTWLALTNTTTFETVTGAQRLWYLAGTDPKDCDLPYSRGLCTNLRLFCCFLDDGVLGCVIGRCRRPRRNTDGTNEPQWIAKRWEYPGTFERESEDVWQNVWENRYWRCC